MGTSTKKSLSLGPAVARSNGIGWAVVRVRSDDSWTEIVCTGLTQEGAEAMAKRINSIGRGQ
jgi:hypothetical protein